METRMKNLTIVVAVAVALSVAGALLCAAVVSAATTRTVTFNKSL